MISFVHPLFLGGMAAVAVPVIIHLTRRDTASRVLFPATALLLGSAEVVRRRRSLAERVLLALRILVIASFVLALARPRLQLGAAPGEERRLASVAIVLDDTPSMGIRWREPDAGRPPDVEAATRMDEARRAVAEILDGLAPGSSIRLQTASRLVADGALDPDEVRRALAALRPTDQAPSLGGALADSAKWVAEEPPPDRALYVVSDFQRSSWRAASGSWLGPGLPARAVDLGRARPDDWGILEVVATEERAYRGVPMELRVRVRSTRRGTREVTLSLDGAPPRTRTVSLGPDETAETAFEIVPQVVGPLVGQFRLGGSDDWPANDSRYFAVTVQPPPSVLVLGASGGDGELAGTLAARALAPFVGGEHQIARVRQTVPPLPEGEDLERVDCVVLAQPSSLGPAEWSRLCRFVEEGGGLLAFADERMSADGFWDSAQGVLPASGSRLRRPAEPVRLGDCRFDHPLLRSFAEGGNGGIGSASFSRYLGLTAAEAGPGRSGQVLAFFSGADSSAPALIEGTRGRGRVVLFGSSPARAWGTFYREPSFVPFMHETTAYLARAEPAVRGYLVGGRPTIELTPAERGARATLQTAGSPPGLVRTLTVDDERLEVALGRLDRRGAFGLVTRVGTAARTRAIAVELAPAESEHVPVDPKSVLGIGAGSSASADEFARHLSSDRGGTEVWRSVLGAAILLFAAEMALAWHLSRKRSAMAGQGSNARGAI